MFQIEAIPHKGDPPRSMGSYETDTKTALYLARTLFEIGSVSIPWPIYRVVLTEDGKVIKVFQR